MNGPGFDWLNTPSSNGGNGHGASPSNDNLGSFATYANSNNTNNGSVSPIPAVSFGQPHLRPQSTTSQQPTPQTTPQTTSQTTPQASSQSTFTSQPHPSSIAPPVPTRHHHSYIQQPTSNHHSPANHLGAVSVDSLISDHSNHDDEYGIPLSLTARELTLQESKTYMRWYSDILARTNSRTITMNDVFNFLHNFKIPASVKEKIQRICHKLLYSINIGEFFALLRLISHTLNGYDPQRKLIKVQAPVPTPPSILSKKRQNDDNDTESDTEKSAAAAGAVSPNSGESKPLDLDGFTQFMLTGERPDDIPKKKRSKKLKSVKFSDQIVTDIHEESFVNSPVESPLPELDYSLPMDQLLKMKQHPQKVDEEDRQVLEEMGPQMNHFQNLHSVDTASINGVPANIDSYNHNQLLRPNMTGPAQMSQLFSPSPEPELLKPNMTGPAQMKQYFSSDPALREELNSLQPNVTGPADMARIFAPSNQDDVQYHQPNTPKMSLQSFTSQMTGNTMANTLQNAGHDYQAPSNTSNLNRPLPPPPVPNNRRTRSFSSPTPRMPSQDNLSLPQPPNVPPRSPLSNNFNSPTTSFQNSSFPSSPVQKVPPPPPPSRRRNASTGNPPPLPPKVAHAGSNNPYSNYSESNNGSTANILDDLKALQEEVDKIRDMTGGF